MGSRLRLALGLVISAICLVAVFRGLSWPAVGQALLQANPALIVLAAASILAGLATRICRWRVLFYPRTDLNFSLLWDALNVGYLASNVLPARAGDLVRPYVLSELRGPPFAWALSTVMVERVLDALTVVALLFALLPFLPLPEWAVRVGLATGGLFVGVALVLLLAARNQEHGQRILTRLLRYTPLDAESWGARLISLLHGFAALGQPAVLWRVAVWSAVTWATAAVSYFAVFQAMGLAVPWTAAVFTLSTVALGMAVPSAPGQVGVFEGVGVAVLMLFTADFDRAVGAILMVHALNYVLTSGMGLWSLARRSLSYRRVVGGAAQQQVRGSET